MKKYLLMVLLLSFSFYVYGEVPPYMNVQGMLRSEAGAPVDGTLSMSFKLYNKEGNNFVEKWSETHQNVNVQKGVFSVILGKTKPLSGIFDNPSLWLGVQIGNDPELPKQEITSVGYAFKAWKADNANISHDVDCNTCIGESEIVDGAITSTKIKQGEITTGHIKDGEIYLADLNVDSVKQKFVKKDGDEMSGALKITIPFNTDPFNTDPLFSITNHKFVVDKWGNVSIGTTDSAGARLRVSGGLMVTKNGSILFETGHTANIMKILDQNVGIGTTGPLGRLHVGGGEVLFEQNVYMSGASQGYWVDAFGIRRNGMYKSSDNSLRFRAGTATEGEQDRVTITNLGNVGIGTMGPGSKLHVQKGSGVTDVSDGNAVAQFESDGNASNIWLNVKNAGAGGTNATYGWAVNGTIQHGLTYNIPNDYVVLTPDGALSGTGNGLVVNTTGKVGIGTTEPGGLLHIHGSGGDTKGIRLTSTGTYSPTTYIYPGTATPDAGFITFGDGTGWKFHIGKRSDAGTTKFVTIQDSGNVGIGTTAPSSKLHVADGCITGSFCSDARLKKNIRPWNERVLNKITSLEPKAFEWKGTDNQQTRVGIVAQDIENVFPEVVTSEHNGEQKGLDCTGLNAIIIQAIKELKAENEELKSRLGMMEAWLNEIQK